MNAKPIITPELVRRYILATGTHNLDAFDAYCTTVGLDLSVRYASIPSLARSMLA
jgi:hypothetical protein